MDTDLWNCVIPIPSTYVTDSDDKPDAGTWEQLQRNAGGAAERDGVTLTGNWSLQRAGVIADNDGKVVCDLENNGLVAYRFEGVGTHARRAKRRSDGQPRRRSTRASRRSSPS